MNKKISANVKQKQKKITLKKKQVDQLFSLHAQGKYSECERACSKILKKHPTITPILNLLGGAIFEQSRLEEAIDVYDKVIKLDGSFSQAYLNKGIACYRLRRLEEAIASLNKVLEIDEGNRVALYTKGIALNELLRFHEAAIILQDVVKVEPENIPAQIACGYAFENTGKIQESIACYNLVVELEPRAFEAISSLARVNSFLGNKERAVSLFEQSLDINPNNARAHRAYSRLIKYKLDSPYIPIMEKIYKDKKLQDKGHAQLCFALAKAYEDTGRYDQSFEVLKEGNDLHKKAMHYDVLGEVKLIQYVMEVFHKSPPQVFSGEFADDDIKPIFILGMPRSGTSLVEQILSSHTHVHGAGELSTVRELLHELIFSKNQARVFSAAERKVFRDRFLGQLKSLNVPEKIIIDKMPHNFMYIGYILSVFPSAKIIHLNRDPIAVCWSMYQRFFPADGLNFCYDLADLATFQRLHDNLMRFWNKLYPGKIYEISYEALTENQDLETRQLLQFCDLPWQDGCLDFHKTEREVKTASSSQVRNKMYKGSSEAWRNFERHLQPLIKGLNYRV